MKYVANFVGKDYNTGAFDLQELSKHNGIEHDGSLIRTLFFSVLYTYNQPFL